MKVSITRIYDTSKHVDGSVELKQLFGRVITFRVIFESNAERNTVLAIGAETLSEESLSLFKAQSISVKNLVWLNVSRFTKLISRAKELGVPVEISYPLEIVVGYADSSEESHSEGTYYHDANSVADLSEEGKKAILSIADEVSKL